MSPLAPDDDAIPGQMDVEEVLDRIAQEDQVWEIRDGDALSRVREIPDGTVQTCITSPPYWNLRDYQVEGQLGLEPTPEEYVADLVEIMAEVRRALRDDGTLFLNLGDSYASSGGDYADGGSQGASSVLGSSSPSSLPTKGRQGRAARSGLKPKDLVGIPWMVALAMRADGWYLRRDIIWSKPNPQPESVTDRPTSAHEYVFLFSKRPSYYYDSFAVRELSVGGHGSGVTGRALNHQNGRSNFSARVPWEHQKTRSRRSVWEVPEDLWSQFLRWLDEQPPEVGDVWKINTKPFVGAHFATFPPELVVPCVLAGAAPRSCGTCGAPWGRLLEKTGRMIQQQNGPRTVKAHRAAKGEHGATSAFETGFSPEKRTVGWAPSCDHDDEAGRCVVLDPFSGAATTGLVATQQGRDYIGVELNADYAQMGRQRILDWEADPAGHLKKARAEADSVGQIGFDL